MASPQYLQQASAIISALLATEAGAEVVENFLKWRILESLVPVLTLPFRQARADLVNKLSGHEGCVNSVSFNSCGDRIASGSDDLHIILWDWQRNRSLLRFNTGHRANVFQSKILPGDLLLTSCSRDGQVRLAELSVTGALRSTKRLAQHKVNTCWGDRKSTILGNKISYGFLLRTLL